MEEKKYYAVLLNNCHNFHEHYIANGKISFIEGVLQKEYQTVDFFTLREDFLELDDRIDEKNDHWVVYGEFPVIVEEIDGKFYDLITGEELKQSSSEDEKELTFIEKHPVNTSFVKSLLEVMSENGIIARYRKGIETRRDFIKKKEQYEDDEVYCLLKFKEPFVKLELATIYPIYAKEINGKMFELYTGKRIYYTGENTVSRKLSYDKKIHASQEQIFAGLKAIYQDELEAYRDYIERTETATIKGYNMYTRIDMEVISKERTKTKKRTND